VHRRFLHGVFILLVTLVAAVPTRGGIYNSADTDAEFKLDHSFDEFSITLGRVGAIGVLDSDPSFDVSFNTPLRRRYFLCEALAGKNPPRDLTLEQEVDYSAVLIRRKSPEAVPYLEQVTRRHPDNLLLQSHLAMAYWNSPGREGRAKEVQRQLLTKRNWPELFQEMEPEQREFLGKFGWSEHPTDFYRRVEGYLLKLMELRSKEPAGQPFQAVDAIFEGGTPPTPIKFVNDKGVFEPGKVSATELKKLPKDAREIVQQLLLWLPDDLRLYWLLGEVYNAEGTKAGTAAAQKIFDQLVFKANLRAPDLRDRRQQLREYVVEHDKKLDVPGMENMLAENEKKNSLPQTPLLPATPQTIAVTFASGFVVGLFALWQLQELRRRRR
jgi:hypothetical protein